MKKLKLTTLILSGVFILAACGGGKSEKAAEISEKN
jgi:hypothetical protein